MWPTLCYEEFKETGYLLHMLVQAIGKLKLITPFEAQWSNVPLFLTSRGLTSGLISHAVTFSIELDLITHEVIVNTINGDSASFKLASNSVANIVAALFELLHYLQIYIAINPKPQEVTDPIDFDKDTKIRLYRPDLSFNWWQILLHSYRIMQQYHVKFIGKTPPIALMWGTLDLRDVRFNGTVIIPAGLNSGYIRSKAMDAAQVEIGWWSGNSAYPRPAYYSFTYPQPKGIEQAKVFPKAARWCSQLGEFILDYDDLLLSKHPEKDLLAFCQSTYEAGASRAGWDPKLVIS